MHEVTRKDYPFGESLVSIRNGKEVALIRKVCP